MGYSEVERLEALASYRIVDTGAEEAFDRLTALAAEMFDAPIALVSLVDETRQWFKSHRGLDICCTDRKWSFCAHAIDMGPDAVMVVEDAAADPRFRANPLVTGPPGIRSYVGAALTTPEGFNLGTLCVIDRKPRRRPTPAKLKSLQTLAQVVVDEILLRQAERDAKDKERLLRLAEQLSGIGRWRLDLATLTSTWSDAVFDIYGVDRETVTPGRDSILALFSQQEQDNIQAHIHEAVATKGGFEFQFEFTRPDGELRYCMNTAICELDADGEPTALFGLLRDITEKVRTERAIRESEAQQRRLAVEMSEQARIAREESRRADIAEQIAGLGHWRVDAKTREMTFSAEMRAIFGLGPDAPVKLEAIMDMFEPDDRAEALERIAHVLQGGVSGHRRGLRIYRTDGELRYLSSRLAPEFGADGEIVAVVGTMLDITNQRRAELALARSEALYRHLADHSRDLIMQCDTEGRVTYVSPSALTMTGYQPAELIGRIWLDFMPPEDAERIRETLTRQVTEGELHASGPMEYQFSHRDGQSHWFEGIPSLVFDPKTGVLTGFTSTIRDVTLRKAHEAELRKARAEAEAASAVKAEFLANMSHELRTPLTAVLGFSRLIEEQPELTETTRGYLARISSGGHALLMTINDILDFSKLEASQVEIKAMAASPARVAADALGLFTLQAADKAIGLEAKLDGLPALTLIDADRVRQILLNLIGNAVKFTEAGGVRLEADYDAQNARLRFDVVDSGPGMGEDGVSRLFKRFSQVDASSTRKHGGTGLGLAICKGLVDAMGGQIGVRSVLGQGSRFWFSIPAPRVAAAEPRPESLAVAPAFPAGCRVLVADDNAMNRALVRAVLTACDAQITEVCDGAQAVAAAAAAPFDVILMDLRMPGLDGDAAARRIRAEDGPNDTTPILAFSADATLDWAQGPFDGAITKPLSAQALVEGVAKALESTPVADHAAA